MSDLPTEHALNATETSRSSNEPKESDGEPLLPADSKWLGIYFWAYQEGNNYIIFKLGKLLTLIIHIDNKRSRNRQFIRL